MISSICRFQCMKENYTFNIIVIIIITESTIEVTAIVLILYLINIFIWVLYKKNSLDALWLYPESNLMFQQLSLPNRLESKYDP